MITVPGQVPAAVTTCGTDALPPTQLVTVAAPADPAMTSPSAARTAKPETVLSDTRVKLPLTSKASLLRRSATRALPPQGVFLPRPSARCNDYRRRFRQRTGKTPRYAFPSRGVLAYGYAPR